MRAVDLFKQRYANTVEQLCVAQEQLEVVKTQLAEATERIAELEAAHEAALPGKPTA